MQNIEVELKVIISEEKYKELLEFFNKEGEFVKKDYQETYYFEGDEDLRIQKNDYFGKIVWKSGKIHDHHREEIEVKFDKEDFEKMEKLFGFIGYLVEIKWFRNRHEFKWKDIDITVDNTKGYAHIIELEKMSTEENKLKTEELLKERLKELGLELTLREYFDTKFNYYKENWKKLTSE